MSNVIHMFGVYWEKWAPDLNEYSSSFGDIMKKLWEFILYINIFFNHKTFNNKKKKNWAKFKKRLN